MKLNTYQNIFPSANLIFQYSLSGFLILFFSLIISCEKNRPEIPVGPQGEINITIDSIEHVGYREALLSISLQNSSNKQVEDFGVCWDTLTNPDITSETINFGEIQDSKSHNILLTSLSPGKKYYLKGFFLKDERPFYGSQKELSTLEASLPEITTDSVSNITINSVECYARILSNKDDTLLNMGFCWAIHPHPTIDDMNVSVQPRIGTFDIQLASLDNNEVYYINAFAVNQSGITYGNELSFKTLNDLSKIGIEMTDIEGGTFSMGCTAEQSDYCTSDEQPVHDVYVSNFKASKHEITNAQYCAFLNESGIDQTGSFHDTLWINLESSSSEIVYSNGFFLPKTGNETHPVSLVTWFGASAFCKWADGRLPTEAEWEYMARGGNAGSGFMYSGSDNADEVAWFSDNSGNKIQAVGTKSPNESGLFDLSGNVQEWCSDWYASDYYDIGEATNPQGPVSKTSKVNRGGNATSPASFCRTADRNFNSPFDSNPYLGFRLVISE